eukprot:5389946-Amphidinium_carterae.1
MVCTPTAALLASFSETNAVLYFDVFEKYTKKMPATRAPVTEYAQCEDILGTLEAVLYRMQQLLLLDTKGEIERKRFCYHVVRMSVGREVNYTIDMSSDPTWLHQVFISGMLCLFSGPWPMIANCLIILPLRLSCANTYGGRKPPSCEPKIWREQAKRI